MHVFEAMKINIERYNWKDENQETGMGRMYYEVTTITEKPSSAALL